jgi:UDP-N-acetylmuramoyl-L-alanyl-D-glutamate--2,6-diaminopimelate ligase
MIDTLINKKIPKFTGISCDSRKVKPGDAFIAINGLKVDGNNYINEAIKKGASVVFSEKKINSTKIPVIQIKDARSFLGRLSAEFYNHPSNKLNVIGITGTNGKTTTSYLIYNLLNYEIKQAGLIGTVEVDTGGEKRSGGLTTPAPIPLQKDMNEMFINNLKYACMEVSSHGIYLKRIEGIKFAVKIGTNISPDHFDLHSNFSEYLNVKKSFLKESSYDTLVLINNDDKYFRNFGQIAINQLNFGIKLPSDVMAININYSGINTFFNYSLKKNIITKTKLKPVQIPIKMKLLGLHNIYNAIIAITVGLYYGIKSEIIQNFFLSFPGVWRRLQLIYNKKFNIIDDCAHNPGSYEAAFRAIKNLKFQKIIIVNSLRGNRGVRINQENAFTLSRLLFQLKDYILITSNCNDVVKVIDQVTNEEEEVFLKTLKENNTNFIHYQEQKDALKKALNIVNNGDLILLLGPHAMDNAGENILKML